jgi:hypothetical protein
MKYLCLGFHSEAAWNALAPAERQKLIDASLAYEGMLKRSGHYVDSRALQSARSAATLRFENGEVLVTDGPFAETKEQLGGVLVLEAIDLNHAISLMSQLPCMKIGGSVEIRPINEALGAEGVRSAVA